VNRKTAGTPRVSVIIPMYNAASTIARTLRSAQAQTERDIEIVVVDDGSVDDGPRIVRAAMAGDPRIHLHTQANAGVAAARNLAISHARGTYIAPLDADDLWMPRKIALQLEALARAGEATAFAYCYFDEIDARDQSLWQGPRKRIDGPALEELLAQDVVGNGSNALMRADFVRQVGGYDPLLRQAGGQGAEDWQVALRLAELGPIVCVPEVMVGYRRTRGNMSGDSLQMLRSARLVAEPFRQRYPDLAPMIDVHIEHRRRWLLARALSEGNLAGIIAMSRDIGQPYDLARQLRWIARPVVRHLASSVLYGIKLRRRRRFGTGSAEGLVGEQFADAAPAGGRRVAEPIPEDAPGNPAETQRRQ
jgi:hypothetical protein